MKGQQAGAIGASAGERITLTLRPPILTTSSKDPAMVKRGAEVDDDKEEPMSPAARLFHQPRFNCYIIAMIGFRKRIDVEVVKAGLEVTLVRHPRFSSVQVVDDAKPRWIRTAVALENHLVVVEPEPSSVERPDRFVEDYVAGLSCDPLSDFSRPLWEIHILNLRTSDAEAVAVVRVHHSIGDGISLTSLLLACTRKVSEPEDLPSLPDGGGGGGQVTHQRKKVGETKWRGWERLLAFVTALLASLRLAWNTVVDVLLFVATAAFLSDTATPLKGKEGVEHKPKRFVRGSLSMGALRAVKRATGSTINDVLLGITAAGLSRYLSRRCEGQLCKNIRLRSTVLVNLRPSRGIHDLAEMMDKSSTSKTRWGNWLGYVILPFAITQREDPLEYVTASKAVADRKKRSLEALCTFSCASFIVGLLGIKVAAALSHRVLSHTTLSFSNVMGPTEEVAFFGHPIAYLAPSVHGHPHALTLHFQSYADKMELVAAVDESAIPDPHQLCMDIAEALRQMEAAAARSSHT